MCIAILKPNDKTLDKELLETCSINNPDGCGFAYVDDNGDIIINKFMSFDEFWEEYSKVHNDRTMLIHFRIATHGNVEIQNCHPFKLNDRMALIHNGIISGYGSKTKNISDTRDFIAKVIGNISHKMWKNPSFRTLVGKAIGYSKLAILDTDNNYYIINEDKGCWNNGVWFSNNSYKKKEVITSVSNNTFTKTKSNPRIVSSTPNATNSTFKYVMYCKNCNKEYEVSHWYEDICPECNGQLVQIGCKHNGKYYKTEPSKMNIQKYNNYYRNKYNDEYLSDYQMYY